MESTHIINFLFSHMVLNSPLFRDCAFYCSEILSLVMPHAAGRKTFIALNFHSDLLYFLKAAVDKKKFLMEEREIILNCFDILNFIALDPNSARLFLRENIIDMLTQFVKSKRFYSLPAFKIIHSLSCLDVKSK